MNTILILTLLMFNQSNQVELLYLYLTDKFLIRATCKNQQSNGIRLINWWPTLRWLKTTRVNCRIERTQSIEHQ